MSKRDKLMSSIAEEQESSSEEYTSSSDAENDDLQKEPTCSIPNPNCPALGMQIGEKFKGDLIRLDKTLPPNLGFKMIILSAPKSSGKDTFSHYLEETRGFTSYALAGPLKRGCKELFGLEEDQLEKNKEVFDPRWQCTPRHIFQYMGTEVCREFLPGRMLNIEPNIMWLKLCEMFIKKTVTQNNQRRKTTNIVVTDGRFKNETDFLRSFPNSLIVGIRREDLVSTDGHKSETSLQEIEPDRVVVNDGKSLRNYYSNIEVLLTSLYGKPPFLKYRYFWFRFTMQQWYKGFLNFMGNCPLTRRLKY